MIDMLNLLEKLEIIEDSREWDLLREIRNSLAHEYPFDVDERIANIKIAINRYEILKKIYKNINSFYKNKVNN